MRAVVAGLFGLVFGLGLMLSGMTDPAKVLAFLDWSGAWDPSLAFVMGGAVLTALPLFAIANRRGASLTGTSLETADRSRIDARLLTGAALFGLGWGLAGICPGPGIVILGLDVVTAAIFVGPMLLGLLLSNRWR